MFGGAAKGYILPQNYSGMINDLEFNQDYSSLLVATDTGHKIYTTDPFGEYYSSDRDGRRKLVVSLELGTVDEPEQEAKPTKFLNMLFSTSLTLIVYSDKPQQLEIHNLKQHVKICTLSFDSDIVDIKLNKKRLVVATAKELAIYDLLCVKLITTLPVVAGAIDLSRDDKTLALAVENIEKSLSLFEAEFPVYHPEKQLSARQLAGKTGYVLLYDIMDLRPFYAFKAHDSAIGNIKMFGSDMIATTSTKGTIVRVFTLEQGSISRNLSFRRGHNPTAIALVVFNHDGTILGCALENTVHLFDLNLTTCKGDEEDDLNDNLANLLVQKEEKKKLMMLGFIKKLPYKNLLEPKRAFAYVRLPGSHARVVLGFSQEGSLYVALYDQEKLYQYKPPKKNSERQQCELAHSYSLV